MIDEICGCESGRYRRLFSDEPLYLAPQTRAVPEDVLDLDTRITNRLLPASPWLGRGRRIEFEVVAKNPPELRAKRGALRFAQALDLLGKVLPIERQVGARILGPPQRSGLLFGPQQEIAIVQIVHWPPRISLTTLRCQRLAFYEQRPLAYILVDCEAPMDKRHIVDEIKRTAASNGGSPLGVRRFATETGIKISDWEGRYWARWSDALQEAGFAANALQLSYRDDELFEQVIPLVRHLGRLPTKAEFRMAARDKGGLASDRTFRKHFGTVTEFASRLRSYCSGRDELNDIATICAAVVQIAGRRHQDITDEKTSEFGFVYLIRSSEYYKIGRSNSVGRRQYELAIQLPNKAQTVHEIRTDDPIGIEAYWHNRFAAKRKNGEWFELAAADIAAFRRRKFM